MKKQSLLLVLAALMLGSCSQPTSTETSVAPHSVVPSETPASEENPSEAISEKVSEAEPSVASEIPSPEPSVVPSVEEKVKARFYNADKTVLLYEEEITKGSTPDYKGETPTLAESAYAKYTFSGWDTAIAPISEDTDFVAMFDETPLFKYTIGDEYCWDITFNDAGKRKFVAQSDNSQMLMFKDMTFNGGTISFDIIYNNEPSKFNVASGIVFGADTMDAEHNTGVWACTGLDPWNDLVAFSKDNGEFTWEDQTKVGAFFADKTEKFHIEVGWDKQNSLLHYYINGNYMNTDNIVRPLTGSYVGIYSDTKSTVFENIEFSNEIKAPARPATFARYDMWEVGENSFKAKGNGQFLMLPEYKITKSCFVEYDINVLDDSTYFNCGSGMVFAVDKSVVTHNVGQFIVVGRDWWGGFDTFQKINGAFLWKDSNKFAGAMPTYNQTYHLKLYINLEENSVTYYWNDATSTQPVDIDLSKGASIGLYSDGVTIFSNISIHD